MNKDKMLFIRMDNKLYQQLKKYADRNDDSNTSLSARRALKMFLEEEKQKTWHAGTEKEFKDLNKS